MKPAKWLFWIEPIKKVVWDPFWWIILMGFILWVPFLRVWWWIFLPFMLHKQLTILYRWWIGWDYGYPTTKWLMFELIPPKEVLTPLKAMEDVFNLMWPVYDTGNFREQWCEGTLEGGSGWASWEIVSIEGKVHFYLRIPSNHKLTMEMAFFNHYPDIEIRQVADYTRLVPPTVPNEEWDSYGEDFILTKPDAYPIKTYEKFFEPQGEKIAAEEKRIDPIVSLLEGMSKLGPGEHYWVQLITTPVTPAEEPGWMKEGENIVAEKANRPVEKKIGFWDDFWYMARQLIFGPEKEGSGESATYSWLPQQQDESGEREMVLTPGERELITEIENKLKKAVFRTTVRGVYVAKRESWSSANRLMLRGYMAHFGSSNLNSLFYYNPTRPKVHYIWRQRRTFLRARRMFRNAVLRFPPLFPEYTAEYGSPILSSEELATLYHFPVKLTGMLAPALNKVEAKKSGPPPNLPIG